MRTTATRWPGSRSSSRPSRARNDRNDDGHLPRARGRPQGALEARQARRRARGEGTLDAGCGRPPQTARGARQSTRARTTRWSRLVDHALSHFVEPELIEPTILHDYPVELSPFARPTDDDPSIVERFEFFVGGMELGNAFTEINDSEEQAQRFAEQAADAARPAGRSGLRGGSGLRDAADRRAGPRHRPPGDGADRQRQHPRRAPLPSGAGALLTESPPPGLAEALAARGARVQRAWREHFRGYLFADSAEGRLFGRWSDDPADQPTLAHEAAVREVVGTDGPLRAPAVLERSAAWLLEEAVDPEPCRGPDCIDAIVVAGEQIAQLDLPPAPGRPGRVAVSRCALACESSARRSRSTTSGLLAGPWPIQGCRRSRAMAISIAETCSSRTARSGSSTGSCPGSVLQVTT